MANNLNPRLQGINQAQSYNKQYVPDEIAYDPYKLCLYNKAIRKGKEKERVLRINIIGNFGQGKSSLARSLIGQSSENITSTNGIDIRRYKYHRTDDGRILASQEDEDQCDIINRIAAVARDVPVIVRPENDQFENVPLVRNVDTEIVDETNNTNQGTVVEPNDKIQVNSDEDVQKKLRLTTDEYGIFSEAVEKQCDEFQHLLDIWDFGGQFIFYATHRLFHSKSALYLLVFDLTSPLDKVVRDEDFPNETGDRNMAYFAKFWMESIDAYTGTDTPVILVGTHKDELSNPDLVKTEYFEKVRSLFDSVDSCESSYLCEHIQKEDFAVDNKNSPDSGVKELRDFILKKHQELVRVVEIPARWIQLEKSLNEYRGRKVITFQDVMDINKINKYPLEDEDQVKLFLTYHHNKGALCFFDDGKPSDPVVIVPRLLVDAFKCIVTSEQFVRKTEARSEWTKLKKEGILTEKLIDKVWSQHEDFKQHKDVLLKFLVKHYVLSPVKRSQSSSNSIKPEITYIVPSMLRDFGDRANNILRMFVTNKYQTQIRLLLKLSRPTVVQIVFHRLVAAVLGVWPVSNFGKEKLLFENVCVFEVLDIRDNISTNHAAVIQSEKGSGAIEMRVVNLLSDEVNGVVVEQVRRFVESFVKKEFGSLTHSYEGNDKPFTRAYRCNHVDHPKDTGSATIRYFSGKEEIRCPDNWTHEHDFYRNAKQEWFAENKDGICFPKVQLSDQHISICAQAVGENWQLLGPYLGIKQAVMDRIKEDNLTASMRIYQMLRFWKDSDCEEFATLDMLVDALRKCPKIHVEWDELKNIRDEFYRTCRIATGFSEPLSDSFVLLNNRLTLECRVLNPSLPVSWQKNGESIYQDDHIQITTEGSQQILSINHVRGNDSGKYSCLCGDAVTECLVKVKDPLSTLEIVHGLTDTEVGCALFQDQIISTATFTCELNKRSDDAKWYYCERCIEQSDKYDIIVEGLVHKLKIKKVTEKDEGMYCLKVEGKKSEARLFVEDTEEERVLLREHFIRHLEKEDTEEERVLLREHVIRHLELDGTSINDDKEGAEWATEALGHQDIAKPLYSRSERRDDAYRETNQWEDPYRLPGGRYDPDRASERREDPYRMTEKRDDLYREGDYHLSLARNYHNRQQLPTLYSGFGQSKPTRLWDPELPVRNFRAEKNAEFLYDLKRMNAIIYEAIYDRTGNNYKELTVEKGDILQVLDRSRNWWEVTNFNGESGYVPYTKMKEYQSSEDYDNF